MQTLQYETDDHLHWVQPKALGRTYELRSSTNQYASLRFEKELGTLATAETAGQRWTFKRVGFLNPRVTARREHESSDTAVYTPRMFGGGILQFNDGRTFHWRSINFWSTQWSFVDSTDRSIVTFKPGSEEFRWADLLKSQCVVEFDRNAAGQEFFPFLLTLGWYLLLLQQSDAAVVAATT